MFHHIQKVREFMRVICAGGGTAGHINPALAIAKHIVANDKHSEFLFIGTKSGMESELVPKAGFDIEFIEVEGFSRSLTPSNVKVAIKAALSVFKAKSIIKKFKPDIVIGTGGYVSGPVLLAASMLRIPTLIHEQNVYAGMTSRMLSGKVDTTCISFEASSSAFSKAEKLVLTGNPIRSEIFSITKKEARERLGVDSRPLIAVFGGSLGAKVLNESIIKFIKASLYDKSFQLLFATGGRWYDDVMADIGENIPDNIKVVPYIYDMENVMNAADLLVCRSGAITLSEITALGKASVLIPSPNVTDNHQYHNAMALADNGAAVVITEEQLSTDHELLNNTIKALLCDKEKLVEMEQQSQKMGIKDGCERIYNEVKLLLKKD